MLYNIRAAWIVTATDAMKYGTGALSLTRIQDLNDFDQTNSAYMNNIDKEVKGILTLHGIRFPKKCVHIIPSVCHHFDVDIAQSVSYNTDSGDTIGRDASLSTIIDIDAFHGVVWSCSQSRGAGSSVNVIYIKRQIISFADSHFQSATTVSAMSQLELGCLASWLSWYPTFFMEEDNVGSLFATGDNIEKEGDDEWHWNQYKDNVVCGLLNVLGSQKHDPKCLSIAVACLSFIIEQHTSSDSVLTDANISQLLRLGLSKAVYPTIDPQTAEGLPAVLAPHWEITFCRIGVRRLLLIPQVLGSESAVNETFTFVSKWWERLKGATKGPGSGFETPGKLMMNFDRKDDNSISLIPVVRCALDIISDLYELVPQIRSYVRHMILGESLLFLTSYLSSSDPKTVVSAATFLSCIIQDFMSKDSPKVEDTVVSESEEELPIGDLKGVYNCATGMLDSYCKMRDAATATTVPPEVGGRKVLSDCTNIITERDEDSKIQKKAERKSMDSGTTRLSSSVSMNTSAQPTKPLALDLAATTTRVVLAPLIASLSNLITTCLQAAETMSGEYSSCFFSPLGLSTHNSTTRSMDRDVEILSSSLRAACHDIVMIGKFAPSNGDPSEQRLSQSTSHTRDVEERTISKCFLHRRNQTVFNLFCALAILQSNSSMKSSIEVDIDNHDMPLIDNYSTFITSLLQCLGEENSGTKSLVPSSLRDALFSALDWGIYSTNGRNVGTTADPAKNSCGLNINENSRLKATKLLKMIRKSVAAIDKTHLSESIMTDVTTGSIRESSGEPILQVQKERKSANRGASECSAASVDDSQTSLLPALTCLGTTTDDNDDDGGNRTSVGSASGMSPLINGAGDGNNIDESSSPCKSWKERCVTLSKIFTPAHSKSREEKNTESDSPVNEKIGLGMEKDVNGYDQVKGPFGANIRSDLFGKLGNINDKDSADKCNNKEDENDDDNEDDDKNNNNDDDEVTTDMCMSVDEDVTSSPPSLCQSNQVLSPYCKLRKSLCLPEGHVDSPAEERTNTLFNADKTVLTAQIAALKSKLESARAENVRLRIARDTIHTERVNLTTQCRTHAADAAGAKAATDFIINENKALNTSLQILDCEVQGLKISLAESQQRKAEQDLLLQEAWMRLSALAKKETATLLLNEQLSAQISHANSRACEYSSLLSALKGGMKGTDSLLTSLQLQLSESQQLVQQQTLKIINQQDELSERNSECTALTAQLNIIQIQCQSDSNSLIICKKKLKSVEKELELSMSSHSAVKLELEKENYSGQSLRSELKHSEELLSVSQSQLEEANALANVWEEKFNDAQCTYKEDLEIQRGRERELRDELEENVLRGDNAENDLQKHKELISFINKLSTEGEAGRAKARRLSAAVVGGSGGEGIEIDSAVNTSVTGERNRKVRKPSNK